MSMAYVRDYYDVPARRGGRIRFEGREGTILSATHNLRVRFDDGTTGQLHPTWHVEYLDPCDGNTRGGDGCRCDPPFTASHARLARLRRDTDNLVRRIDALLEREAVAVAQAVERSETYGNCWIGPEYDFWQR